ncbi:hypothetical protein [Robertmurraya sp. FSL R5-0851]|uniref:hypothetical protein n=1 Tax=Robertmurraya sp. FSL R5-0851 TaxID=2921584 RepID=UPI0030FA3F3B
MALNIMVFLEAQKGLIMRGNFRTSEKIVRDGSIQLKVLTYFLTELDCGIRIEVRTLTTKFSTSVEVELLHGDDQLILKKSYLKEILSNPKRPKIADKIEEYIQYAYNEKLIR